MRPLNVLKLAVFASAAFVATAGPARAGGASPVFDPIRFFAGHTEGRGRLKIVLTPHRTTVVHGQGHLAADGSLVLDQTVVEGDQPATTREWVIRTTAGRYAGTLTDASGPVAIEVDGPRLHLHFHMKGGIIADQRLVLAAGGEVAQNDMTFRKLGIVVATLDETIRRVG